LVVKGMVFLRKTLPTWQIASPSFAGKAEVPRSALLLRCMVESIVGPEEWQFTIQLLDDGRLKLLEAKAIG